jgi:hypothetical protein
MSHPVRASIDLRDGRDGRDGVLFYFPHRGEGRGRYVGMRRRVARGDGAVVPSHAVTRHLEAREKMRSDCDFNLGDHEN